LSGTYLEVERRLLERALLRSGGNKSEAARMLGLKRTTFLDKLRRHGLEQRAAG
jgi:DNA-binding NtrC family response regulator